MIALMTSDATAVADAQRKGCAHHPACPDADAPDRDAARTIVRVDIQGWSLLCNGVIVFDDLGEILPDATAVPSRR